MNEKEGEIQTFEIELSDITRLRICLKSSTGKLYIDARKWFKYPNRTDYLPSEKGLMLGMKEWKQAIEQINELIGANIDKAA